MASDKQLIVLEDAMNKLRAYAERKHGAGHIEIANGILKAMNYIRNEMPRVDAVEVVRCKDCRFYETGVEYYPDGTKDICRLLKRQMLEDGYCSVGERKDGGHETVG